MKEIKRVSLIGLGAMGTKYAEKLYPALERGDFLCIASKNRKDKIDKGMYINGVRHNFIVVTPQDEVPPADLVMIATKAYHLPQAAIDIKNHVGPNTIIFSLINGIESEELFAKMYGPEHIVYAKSAGLGATRIGNKITYNGMGYIMFGELKNEVWSDRVKAIAALLKKVGITYDVPVDMEREIWWKYMVNVGCNQVSAIVGADYHAYHTVPQVFELTENVMREVVQIANHKGIDLNEDDILRWHNKVLKYDPEDKTSLLQDIENGKKTEVDTYAGKVIQLGRELGIPTPLNECIYLQLKAMEQIRGAK
ncbi:MAG: ketopantoate reductase family protein [Christensenellales bacterium]|jgi:2-dehydropantoate 2-reductase